MKRMNYLAMVLALALSMPATDMVAQHTGYRGGTTTGNPGGGRRPDSNPQRQPGNNRHDRPDNKHHDRPGNDRHDRPGNDRYDRPGNNRYDRPGNDRYDRPNSSHHRHPGNPGNPGHYGHPGNPGSTNHHHGFHPTPPPPRPYRPIVRPAPRPVPPPAFRPCPTAPMLTAVFGLPFGISINISIDNLRRDGYYIDGYNNNEVYLRNVYEMNYSWDDGVVIYIQADECSLPDFISRPMATTLRASTIYIRKYAANTDCRQRKNTATERKQSHGMTATAATTCRLPTTT